MYEIEPSVIRGLSKDCICPADGQAGSAYIDAIADQSVGTADYMLSYTWGYTLVGCAVPRRAAVLSLAGLFSLRCLRYAVWSKIAVLFIATNSLCYS